MAGKALRPEEDGAGHLRSGHEARILFNRGAIAEAEIRPLQGHIRITADI